MREFSRTFAYRNERDMNTMTNNHKPMRSIDTRVSGIISRTDAVSQFLADARKYAVMTAEEEAEAFKALKNGDEVQRTNIVNANLRFVFSLASKFAKGDEILDLCSCATIGMMEAMDSFEYQRGFRFLSYAVHYMRMEISNYFLNVAPMIRRTNAAIIGSKDKKLAEKFYQSEHREPTEDELKEMLEKEYNIELGNRMDTLRVSKSSLSEEVGEDATAEEIGEVAVRTASINEYEVEVEKEQTARVAGLFIKTLAPREQNIIKKAFGIGCEAMLDEAIAEEYGMTSERVRQIKEQAIKKMKGSKSYVMAIA